MISICGQYLIGNVQRINCRFLASVVPKCQVDDFSVKNEPIFSYLKGSKERKELEKALDKMSNTCQDVPIMIGDKEYRTKEVKHQVMPHDHKKSIAKYYWATKELVKEATEVASAAQLEWDRVPLNDRIKMWRKAAELMAGKYRMELNAATMLGQAKTIIQAEIDSACELVDFFRFNAFAAKDLTKYQPISENPSETLNTLRYRGLEGFVAAVSPFNFTAIGGNLAYTPALMGCSVVWKPSDTALLSNYIIYKVMREAGLPPGVVNFVPADGPVFGNTITSSYNFAGLNFTGSVATFNILSTQVGNNVGMYRGYPRLIGECGGKNYHFIHPSADVESVVMGTVRSAFEFCGQKCSACSRMYVPESLYPKVIEGLQKELKDVKMGDVQDVSNFVSAVIDEKAFDRIKSYIDYGKSSKGAKIIAGGHCDKSKGYFIEPTIIEVNDLRDKLMVEEIFGPVLSIYKYADKDVWSTLSACCNSTPYALTGAVFAQDQEFWKRAIYDTMESAGNFYINDKSTGSVVGQQPFGGARKSGTNDKAGGPHYILRWASPQSIKETFVPLTAWKYPYMSK